jgi:hypothetical protein
VEAWGTRGVSIPSNTIFFFFFFFYGAFITECSAWFEPEIWRGEIRFGESKGAAVYTDQRNDGETPLPNSYSEITYPGVFNLKGLKLFMK